MKEPEIIMRFLALEYINFSDMIKIINKRILLVK
jgi:hypothetical protein